jgi:hypothetical protein
METSVTKKLKLRKNVASRRIRRRKQDIYVAKDEILEPVYLKSFHLHV